MHTIKFDHYAGVEIIVEYIPKEELVTLVAADNSVQVIQNIGDSSKYTAKLNAGFFNDQRNTPLYGEAYGVQCGDNIWEVPRQGKFIYYAIMHDGRTEVGMDTDFWYTRTECRCASSPALVLKHNGYDCEWISPSRTDRRSLACCQSVLMRTKEYFLYVITRGKLTPNQIKAWSVSIPNVLDIVFNDGGGSACLTDENNLYTATGENRRIANAWGAIAPKQSASPQLPNTEAGGDKNMLTMNGIDISNWQKDIDLRKIDFDFVIVKATEGTYFVDKYCDGFIQTAKAMGKKFGFYHFARPTNDAIKEADFFIENTKNYFGEGIPVLDWEAENKNDVQWALRWLNRVKEKTGVKPLIYMSESVINTYDWSPVVAGDYGLWVAKYRDSVPDYNYDMSLAGTAPKVKWWKGYAMWQWTSVGKLNGYNGSLDCDVFYGNASAWDAYAKSSASQQVKPTDPEPPVSTDDVEKLKKRIDILQQENENLWDAIDVLKKRIATALEALNGGDEHD